MKKLTILICVLAILLSLTGVAWASKPEEGTFSITGYTIWFEYETLPSGLAKLHLKAAGDPDVVPETGVTGYFEGAFTFEEWIIFDQVSGRGTNHAIMTIYPDGGGQVDVRWGGQSYAGEVWGHFTVLHGSGLHGQGTYTGDAALFGFTVTFTGRFHTDP